MENEEAIIVPVEIDELIINCDLETARKLENDLTFREYYVAEIRRQFIPSTTLKSTNNSTNTMGSNGGGGCQALNINKPVWTSSKSQSVNDQNATLLLLSLRKKYHEEFKNKLTNKNSLWLKIARELNNNNFFVGEGIDGREKCRHKFANLQAAYIKYLDKKRLTGEGKIPKPQYFEDLDEILGDKHKANPVLVLDSVSAPNISKKEPEKLSNTRDNTKEKLILRPNILKNVENNTSSSQISDLDGDELPGPSGTQINRFSKIKQSLKPDKNKLLQKLVDITEETVEVNKRNFDNMLTFMKSESEKRHEQIMALIKASKKNKNKRKRESSDDESD